MFFFLIVTQNNEFSANEIAELRSTMLAMGVVDNESGVIDDKGSSSTSTSSSTTKFYVQLAHQLSNLLFPLLKDQGCIDLATAYCRINRARGMDLISPDDLLRACRQLEKESLPIRLKCYANGLLVSLVYSVIIIVTEIILEFGFVGTVTSTCNSFVGFWILRVILSF